MAQATESSIGLLGQSMFRIAALPARAAYLIGARSSVGLRRAVQEASTRWAGATEPIIPVRLSGSVDPWWEQVVRLSKVDGFVNVDADPDAAEKVSKQLDLPLIDLAHIDRAGITQFTAHPAAVAQLPPTRDSAIIATTESDLWEVVAAGDLTTAHQEDLHGTELVVRRPRTTDEIGRAELLGATLCDLTNSQFRERSASSGPWPSPCLIWVTTPNSFRDCLWYWNIRALRPLRFADFPMILVPHRYIDHWVGYEEDVANALARSEDIEPDVILCSRSVREDRLHEVARAFDLVPSTEEVKLGRKFPSPPPKRPPYTYHVNLDVRQFVVFDRSYGETTDSVVQLYRDRTTVRVDSPVQFHLQGRMLARVSSSAFDGLPRRKVTAEIVAPNANWSHGDLQIATSAANRINLDLRIPSISEAAWSLLEASTAKASLSDKGQLGTRLEELALSDILLVPGVIGVIRHLTTPRSKTLMKELAQLRAEGSTDADLANLASSWGGRTERRYKCVDDLKAAVGPSAAEAAEGLVAELWAERGLEVRCDQCQLRSFVVLAETTPQPRCPACRAPQQYQAPGRLTMQYRLNAILDRASDQGVVPHLFSVACLRAHGEHVVVLPGVDVDFHNGEKAEIDLYGLYNGGLIAGEVKTSPNEFTESQVARDVKWSSLLDVDRHVMASLEPIPGPIVDLALAFARRSHIGLTLVEGNSVRELE